MHTLQAFSQSIFPRPPSSYKSILRQIGWLFIAVAVAKFSWPLLFAAYKAEPLLNVRLSLPFFALFFGLGLLWSNLRFASAARWLLVFSLAASTISVLFDPLHTPLGFRFAQLRFDFADTLRDVAFALVQYAGAIWIVVRLGAAPIHAARDALGRPRRNMLIPAGLAVALIVAVTAFSLSVTNGKAAERALAEARAMVGADYALHISELTLGSARKSTRSYAVVSAWNSKELKTVRVEWER